MQCLYYYYVRVSPLFLSLHYIIQSRLFSRYLPRPQKRPLIPCPSDKFPFWKRRLKILKRSVIPRRWRQGEGGILASRQQWRPHKKAYQKKTHPKWEANFARPSGRSQSKKRKKFPFARISEPSTSSYEGQPEWLDLEFYISCVCMKEAKLWSHSWRPTKACCTLFRKEGEREREKEKERLTNTERWELQKRKEAKGGFQ